MKMNLLKCTLANDKQRTVILHNYCYNEKYSVFTLSKDRTIKLSLWYQESVYNGCKESQFYSLPFGQAVASMY